MKQIDLAGRIDLSRFDGRKFAARYNLSSESFLEDGTPHPRRFWLKGTVLNVPDDVPDDPVLEENDPPKPQALIRVIKFLVRKKVITLRDVLGDPDLADLREQFQQGQ